MLFSTPSPSLNIASECVSDREKERERESLFRLPFPLSCRIVFRFFPLCWCPLPFPSPRTLGSLLPSPLTPLNENEEGKKTRAETSLPGTAMLWRSVRIRVSVSACNHGPDANYHVPMRVRLLVVSRLRFPFLPLLPPPSLSFYQLLAATAGFTNPGYTPPKRRTNRSVRSGDRNGFFHL